MFLEISKEQITQLLRRRIMYNKGPVDKVVRKSFLWNNSYRRDAA